MRIHRSEEDFAGPVSYEGFETLDLLHKSPRRDDVEGLLERVEVWLVQKYLMYTLVLTDVMLDSEPFHGTLRRTSSFPIRSTTSLRYPSRVGGGMEHLLLVFR